MDSPTGLAVLTGWCWHLLGVTGCKEAFKNILVIALVASELEKV